MCPNLGGSSTCPRWWKALSSRPSENTRLWSESPWSRPMQQLVVLCMITPAAALLLAPLRPHAISLRTLSVKCSEPADDLYEVLGVNPDATAAQIKQAYRRLALRKHPDVNKSPDAQVAFARIADAYSILIVVDKRRQFDARHRASASGGVAQTAHKASHDRTGKPDSWQPPWSGPASATAATGWQKYGGTWGGSSRYRPGQSDYWRPSWSGPASAAATRAAWRKRSAARGESSSHHSVQSDHWRPSWSGPASAAAARAAWRTRDGARGESSSYQTEPPPSSATTSGPSPSSATTSGRSPSSTTTSATRSSPAAAATWRATHDSVPRSAWSSTYHSAPSPSSEAASTNPAAAAAANWRDCRPCDEGCDLR